MEKNLIEANMFSQWLKLRAVVIKMKNLRNTTRTRDQQIIEAEILPLRLPQQQPFDEDVNPLTSDKTSHKRVDQFSWEIVDQFRSNQ